MVIKDFINQSTTLALERLSKVDSAILTNAKDHLHQLKSSAGNSGMMRLYDLCVKAEEHVLMEEWSETEALYASVVGIVAKLKLAFEV